MVYLKKIIFVLLFLCLFSFIVFSGTVSQHVIVGEKLGEISDSKAEAFLLGFTSHIIMDSLNYRQYVFDIFDSKDYPVDLVVFESVITISKIYQAKDDKNKLWGIIGALSPDIIEGCMLIEDNSSWYKGENFFPWHKKRARQKYLSKNETMGVTLFLLSLSGTF